MRTQTITVQGFIHYDTMRARHPEIWPTPYIWREYEPSTGSNCVLVCKQTVTLEVPEKFDPRPGMVEALEEQKRKAHAEFAATVARIDRQISELQAIEYTPEAA